MVRLKETGAAFIESPAIKFVAFIHIVPVKSHPHLAFEMWVI